MESTSNKACSFIMKEAPEQSYNTFYFMKQKEQT